MRNNCSWLVSIAGLTIGFVPSAFGQVTTGPQPSAAQGGLQEIVVTARKVEENIIYVPVAVTAFSAKELEERGILDIHGLDAYTPGFTDIGGPSFGRFQRSVTDYVIRGMVPGRTVDPLRQNVTVFEDGVPVSGGNVAGLSDIDRVEVVKGPQSAYFGRSTFAGAINLITLKPSFQWNAKLDTQFYSYGSNDTTLSVEGPIVSDTVAFRLSGRYYTTDGQYLNPDGGRLGAQETKSGTAQILIKPSDSFEISLFGTYWTDDDGPQIDGVIGGPWATVTPNAYNCNMGLVPPGQLNGVCGPVPGMDYVSLAKDITALNQPPIYNVLVLNQGVASLLSPGFIDHFGLHRTAWRTHGNVQYDLPAGYVFSVNVGADKETLGLINDGIQQQMSDPAFLYNGFYAEDNQSLNNLFSAEARISSPRNRSFRWLFGVNYLDETTQSADVAWFFGPFNYGSPEKENARTIGYFGSVEFDLPYRFEVTAEARYQQDKVTNTLELIGTGSAQETFDSFTPRLILSNKLTDNTNAYVSYARGNKPGTFNLNLLTLTPAQLAVVEAQTNGQLAVPEETVDMFELGLKGDFLENRLRVLAAAYYANWKNQQITKTGLYQTPNTSGGLVTISIPVVASVGLTKLSGFELEAEYSIVHNLLFELNFNYTHSNIRDYECANCATYETGTPNVTGNMLPLVPKIKTTGALTYRRQVFSGYEGFARLEDVYRDKIYADETNLTWVSPSNIVNLRIGLQNDRYSVQLFGKNIFNDTTYQSIAWGGSFLAASVATINQWDVAPAVKPTFGVQFTARLR
jgi:iron complex outermembrane recepter protein